MKLWDAIMAATVLAGAVLAGAQLVRAETGALPEGVEGRQMLQALARADVITANCPGLEISNDDWARVNQATNVLAARLGLDPASYERDIYGPAFALLDEPGACERFGPEAAATVARLRPEG